MPFVIDMVDGEPVKYPKKQWCELQFQFNIKPASRADKRGWNDDER